MRLTTREIQLLGTTSSKGQDKGNPPCGPLAKSVCDQNEFINKNYSSRNVFLDIPYSNYDICESTLKQLLLELGLQPVVAKDKITSNDVLCKVCKIIRTCKYGITDISSGSNSVSYEYGLMHGLGMKVCLAKRDIGDKFSDINGLEHTPYSDINSLKIIISKWIMQNIEEADKKKAESLINTEEALIKNGNSTPLLSLNVPAIKFDDKWFLDNQKSAFEGLRKASKLGFMEIKMAVINTKIKKNQKELLESCSNANIHTFGWPIGVVFNNNEELRPKPDVNGIRSEICPDKGSKSENYDYWALREDGAYYLLKSLFEDDYHTDQLFFNTRISRITESILFANKLYTNLGAPPEAKLIIWIRHGGLQGRKIGATGNRHISQKYQSYVDESYAELEVLNNEIQPKIIENVKQFTAPLFSIFNYFEVPQSILDEIIQSFIKGKII